MHTKVYIARHPNTVKYTIEFFANTCSSDVNSYFVLGSRGESDISAQGQSSILYTPQKY